MITVWLKKKSKQLKHQIDIYFTRNSLVFMKIV